MQYPIILFDGVCNLCNTSVQRIIKYDTKGVIMFASLQSSVGQQFLKAFNLPIDSFDSMVFIDGEKEYYLRSTAALKIAKSLGGLWSLFYVFILIPRPIRDMVYNFVARNRFRWFGKRDTCLIPTPELKSRFLE